MTTERLSTYRSKRDFSKTSEPEGAGISASERPGFVVQKHAARALHYDVRFEVDGVLASWAVPKGPSYDPAAKRLAVHVEDHPLEYRDFEGTIPEHEYGSGGVIVWDTGTYRNLTERRGRPVAMGAAIENGHFSVFIEGTKLQGAWAFTRTARPGDRQESWVMVKQKDEFANPGLDVVKSAPRSVTTGRALEEVVAGEGPTWERARATFVAPMLAELAKEVPRDATGWLYERKLDGLRAVAVRNGAEVELYSRGRQSFTGRFPQIVQALSELPVDNFTLDGEIVAYEGDRTSFSLLQAPDSTATPVYEIFDVVHLFGSDTRQLPLVDRQRLVAELVEGEDLLRAVRPLDGDPTKLLEQACRDGWEGIMAKRGDSPYRSGRSSEWRKLKCSASQELVIGGYTDPSGKRQHFGALLVGYYEDGRLRYAGKVGTGFSDATLNQLGAELQRRAVGETPFVDLPRMRGAHFVAPELVANVAFGEWTRDGRLRHPRYLGLRPDKAARDVRRERPS